MAEILIVGCGDLGAGLATQLVAMQHKVTAIRRTGTEFPDHVVGITGDVLTLSAQQLPKVDMIFLITTPTTRTPAAYEQAYLQPAKHLLKHYCQQKSVQDTPPKIFFVSSTSVYGQNNGELLTEQDTIEPSAPTAKVLAQTEQVLLASLPATVIRFSGIYGAGRFRLLEDTQARKPWSVNKWTNRIHRDDCVSVLVFLAQHHLQQNKLAPVYIATDDLPVSSWEVKLWLATTMGVTPSLSAPLTLNDFIPTSGKRLSNKALRALGFELKYPNYVVGYNSLIQSYMARNLQ